MIVGVGGILLLNSELRQDTFRIQPWILTEEDFEVEVVEEAGRQLPLHQVTASGLKDLILTRWLHGEVWEVPVWVDHFPIPCLELHLTSP